jgi:hypothetical protein
LDLRLTGNYRGKGTPRRKVKKVHKNSGTDDKKLQTALKKLNVQPIQAIEEVNMFKSDGNVIHFSAPKGTSRTSTGIRKLQFVAAIVKHRSLDGGFFFLHWPISPRWRC